MLPERGGYEIGALMNRVAKFKMRREKGQEMRKGKEYTCDCPAPPLEVNLQGRE